MSYGFDIYSGTTTLVESISSENPPGVFVDEFVYTYSTTTFSKSYPSFIGNTLLPLIFILGSPRTQIEIEVDNPNKTIHITGRSGLGGVPTPANNAQIVVLGF
jgi:hypothetical protein